MFFLTTRLDNPNLVYAIVRNHTKFEKLRDFTLEKAIAEIERAQQRKQEKTVLNDNKSSESVNTTNSAAESGSNPKTDQDGLSEKARGKLPESASTSSLQQPQTGAQPERQASGSSTASVTSILPGAKNGFIPTEQWVVQHYMTEKTLSKRLTWHVILQVSEWHSKLPLHPLLVLIGHLVPQVQSLCTTQSLVSDAQVLEFLRTVTLVGILPPPPPIFIRKFRWGEALAIWFRSMLWGQAYVSSITEYCPWNGTLVKLFQIKQQTVESSSSSSATTSTSSTSGPAAA